MIQVIKRPLVTEKNTGHAEQNVYAFEVDKRANKTDIKKAIERVFRVKVSQVRTLVCRDRARRVGKSIAAVKYYKKALVKLAAGEKIQMFEGV